MDKRRWVAEGDLIAEIEKYSELEWFIAMGASDFVSASIRKLNEIDLSKLLEIRAFNTDYEIKAIRGSLGVKVQKIEAQSVEDYEMKEIGDNLGNEKEERDRFQLRSSRIYQKMETVTGEKEKHYLDIDTSKRTCTLGEKDMYIVQATGGGVYDLPRDDVAKIRIENFYREDEKGFSYPIDFRIVEFLKEGE